MKKTALMILMILMLAAVFAFGVSAADEEIAMEEAVPADEEMLTVTAVGFEAPDADEDVFTVTAVGFEAPDANEDVFTVTATDDTETVAITEIAPEDPADLKTSEPEISETDDPLLTTGIGGTETDGESASSESYPGSNVGVISVGTASHGHGTITDIEKYWTENGYPEYVSYACNIGGVMEYDAETAIEKETVFYEIGLVGATDAYKEEILALVAENCYVTFTDAKYPYSQRIAAFDAINELGDDNILSLSLVGNNDKVLVYVPDGDAEKVYTEMFSQKYGDMIIVLPESEITVADDGVDAIPEGEMVLTTGVDSGAEVGVSAAPQPGIGVIQPKKVTDVKLFIVIAAVLVIAIAGVAVAMKRKSAVPVPASGESLGGQSGNVGNEDVVAAVKDSETAPAPDTFDKIVGKIEDSKKD